MIKNKNTHLPEYSELVQHLTWERKRLGLSQTEVAKAVGMSQSDISKIENQERRMDVHEFRCLLAAYHIHDNPRLGRLVRNFLGAGDAN